jgi:hypothetical protein
LQPRLNVKLLPLLYKHPTHVSQLKLATIPLR